MPKIQIVPIGSLYISTDDTHPSELFSGTWAEITDVTGRIMVGLDLSVSDFNEINKFIGTKTVGLTATNMASHNHTTSHLHLSGNVRAHFQAHNTLETGVPGAIQRPDGSSSTNVASRTSNTNPPASSNPTNNSATINHENLMPYIVVKIYKRTS